MSNPILATTNSKLDTRVKELSGVVPPPSGVGLGSLDRFKDIHYKFSLPVFIAKGQSNDPNRVGFNELKMIN